MEVLFSWSFVAIITIVEIVIPVHSVEYEKAQREYEDKNDVHQPEKRKIKNLSQSHPEYENL